MNILILGSGGREHAFAWKIKQSPNCQNLFVAPGNAGTAQIAKNINLNLSDFEEIGNFCLEENITLLLVGPEAPLVAGIVDAFKENENLKHIAIIGPNQEAAQLEGSKDFSKNFMFRHHIPTAQYQTFTKENLSEAKEYLKTQNLPIVLKADGLAAGKGVLICPTYEEADKALEEMLLEQKFGDASMKVVIEEYLEGIELSVFVLTDGKNYKILPEAKDYKRIGEGDTGLNTGGMGAISPVPFADKVFLEKVENQIIKPTLEGFQKEDITYVGFIFIGLMKVGAEPFVIEYNARMGDPENEVVMPRLKTDLVELLQATARKELDKLELETSEQVATTVMTVSGGYPEKYEKGKLMTEIQSSENLIPFHAGTKLDDSGNILTNGGRVMAFTGLANTMEDALKFSLEGAETVQFEGKYFRKDIGKDLM